MSSNGTKVDGTVLQAMRYIDQRIAEMHARIEDMQRELTWLQQERRKILDEAAAQAKAK